MTCDLRSVAGKVLPHLLVASVLSLSSSACTPQPFTVTREPTTLRLAAADSCEGLVQEWAVAYRTARPWVTVTLEVVNNALATDALRAGEADLALLSWGSVEEEGRQSLWMEPVARDAVAVIVHPASSLSEIGLVQLREIFRGQLQEQHGEALTIVSREDGSGTRAAFEAIVLEGGGTTLNAVVMPSNEAVVDLVSTTPSAIGYVSTRWLDDRVRALPVDGVVPVEETIASKSYPLGRELHLASSGEPTGEARQFAQWLLGGGSIDRARR